MCSSADERQNLLLPSALNHILFSSGNACSDLVTHSLADVLEVHDYSLCSINNDGASC